jgi:hypothetical protein
MGSFQADVEFRLALIALADNWGLAFGRLEVGVRPGGSKGVVRQTGGYEQESRKENRRQGDGVDHPVADACDDLEKRAFPGGACSHG